MSDLIQSDILEDITFYVDDDLFERYDLYGSDYVNVQLTQVRNAGGEREMAAAAETRKKQCEKGTIEAGETAEGPGPSKPKQPAYQPINHQHYRKLIGKIAKQAIAIQRKRRVKC